MICAAISVYAGNGFGSPPAPHHARVRLPQSSQQLELRLVLRHLYRFQINQTRDAQVHYCTWKASVIMCVCVSQCVLHETSSQKNACLHSRILCCLTQVREVWKHGYDRLIDNVVLHAIDNCIIVCCIFVNQNRLLQKAIHSKLWSLGALQTGVPQPKDLCQMWAADCGVFDALIHRCKPRIERSCCVAW